MRGICGVAAMPSETPYYDEEHARKCVIAYCEAEAERLRRRNARNRHEKRYGLITKRENRLVKLRNRILALGGKGRPF